MSVKSKLLIALFTFTLLLSACGGDSSTDNTDSSSNVYPIHRNITVTNFYVGELASAANKYIPNIASAWDDIWMWHYGGVDTPDNRSGYFPAMFVPTENPFYFALPFNDFDENGNKKPIDKLIPWYYPSSGSILKNRWIKIIKGDKVAYAQWEDVGPFGEDDFDYVFGDAPPQNQINDNAGLDVSPAVKDYLGLKDIDKVDWQFVDAEDVPDGPWKQIITTDNVTWMDFPQLTPQTSFYIQLTGTLRTGIPADVYDVDLFDTPQETIQALKDSGKIVICYFSAGTYEDWREDASEFNDEDIGNPVEGWEGEWWLNINSDNVRNIMKERLDLAKEKGCDGVDPDNVDGYENDTGFDLTYMDQFNYNRFLAIEAKKRGLLIGLKNDLDQIHDLVEYFDFAVNEDCHVYGECNKLEPFIEENKPVLNIEYDQSYLTDSTFSELCAESENLSIQTIVAPYDLDGSFVKSCSYGDY